MIQTSKIQEFTQLSFMQATSQGYTSEQNENVDNAKQNKSEATENLGLVSNTSSPGNREIDHELVYIEELPSKREALIRERNLKKASRERIHALLIHPKTIPNRITSY